MALKPNRPVRVGTTMTMTDSKGEILKTGTVSGEDDLPDLSGMTKAELVELAESKGVEVSTSDTKAEIIAKLS